MAIMPQDFFGAFHNNTLDVNNLRNSLDRKGQDFIYQMCLHCHERVVTWVRAQNHQGVTAPSFQDACTVANDAAAEFIGDSLSKSWDREGNMPGTYEQILTAGIKAGVEHSTKLKAVAQGFLVSQKAWPSLLQNAEPAVAGHQALREPAARVG